MKLKFLIHFQDSRSSSLKTSLSAQPNPLALKHPHPSRTLSRSLQYHQRNSLTSVINRTPSTPEYTLAETMASQMTLANTLATSETSRKSYPREFKLSVVKFYRENNLYKTSKKFSLNTKTLLRWKADEEKILDSPTGSRHVKHSKGATYPQTEKALFREFQELRKKGLKVKGYWFKIRAKQILSELQPEAHFVCSDGWFDRFKARHKISLRRPTNTA